MAVRLLMVARCAWAVKWQVVVSAMLVVLLGEAYMRLPFVVAQLEYEPDDDLDGRLAPNQVGFLWLANMSLQSPTIRLNRDGNRGAETDWSRPVVVALGDSEWFGAGVEDGEVWTSILEGELRRESSGGGVQVVNASHPGFGPYHQFVSAQRLFAARSVQLLLVRVSLGQRNFKAVPLEERSRRLADARLRYRVRHMTRFVPFLLNKVEAQVPSIRSALHPTFLREAGEGGGSTLADSTGRVMWEEARMWWEGLAVLAEGNHVPVVFVVHDIQGEPGSRVLQEELTKLADRHRDMYVFRLGPESLSPTLRDPEGRRSVIRETLTLRRDPHANSIQHRLTAQAVLRWLSDSGLKGRINDTGGSLVETGR